MRKSYRRDQEGHDSYGEVNLNDTRETMKRCPPRFLLILTVTPLSEFGENDEKVG